MSKKTIWGLGLIALIVLVGIGALVAYTFRPAAKDSGPTWATFENTALGIILAYPSDVLVPESGAATATTSINIPYIGKTIQDGNAYDGIRIATEDTDAKDAAQYFATPGVQTPYPPTQLMIGDISAMELDEMAYADYSIYLVHDGKLYIVTINMPADEAAYVKNSIHFIRKP